MSVHVIDCFCCCIDQDQSWKPPFLARLSTKPPNHQITKRINNKSKSYGSVSANKQTTHKERKTRNKPLLAGLSVPGQLTSSHLNYLQQQNISLSNKNWKLANLHCYIPLIVAPEPWSLLCCGLVDWSAQLLGAPALPWILSDQRTSSLSMQWFNATGKPALTKYQCVKMI